MLKPEYDSFPEGKLKYKVNNWEYFDPLNSIKNHGTIETATAVMGTKKARSLAFLKRDVKFTSSVYFLCDKSIKMIIGKEGDIVTI
mmetsp:Transcript_3216/g.2689  ORF Transcript_3216/g.2689 Transcript_3216/m.2689 type:complete len:86 (+) Transcript_3216:819-1076(+)